MKSELRSSFGGALVRVLVGCAGMAIGALAVRQLQHRESGQPASAPPQPEQPTPAPIAPVVEVPVPPPPPAPVVVQATPTPAPVIAPTPTPAPAPLELATVAANPALWPRNVTLLLPKNFPLSINGRLIGEAKAPAGIQVRLLRISGQQVEVEFQNARRMIPADSTDLMQRSLAISKNGGLRPSEPPGLPVASLAAPSQMSANVSMNPPPPGVIATHAKIGDHLTGEVIPSVKTNAETRNYHEKTDRIKLKVKLTNKDSVLPADKLKGEVYLFAESAADRNVLKILDSADFEFSLRPLGSHEMATPEVATTYGARLGYRYVGWLLRVRDSAGELVLNRSGVPELSKKAEKVSGLAKDKIYDRTTFKEKTTTH